MRGEDCGIEIGEGLGKAAAWLVGSGQGIGGIGGTEKLCGTIDERRNGVVEHDFAGRQRGFRRCLIDQFRQFAARWKHDLIDLGKIVVFTCQPKNGGVGLAVAVDWRARAMAVAALNGV